MFLTYSFTQIMYNNIYPVRQRLLNNFPQPDTCLTYLKPILLKETRQFSKTRTKRQSISKKKTTITVSDEAIVRDVYYNGCPRRERAAVILRLSPNWFRFGSLEILSRSGEITVLRQLSDFIIKVGF